MSKTAHTTATRHAERHVTKFSLEKLIARPPSRHNHPTCRCQHEQPTLDDITLYFKSLIVNTVTMDS